MKRSKVEKIIDAAVDAMRVADDTLTEPPLLRVEWRDTFSGAESGWTDHDGLVERSKESMLVVSVGFFRHSNKHHVVLVGNQASNGLHFGEVHITYEMIEKVVAL